MLTLLINSPTAESATIPVSWGISKKLAQELTARGAVDPHLLLSIRHGNWEQRYLIPLTEPNLQYVQFGHPGANRICATIVWCRTSALKRREVLSRHALQLVRENIYSAKLFSPHFGYGSQETKFQPELIGDWTFHNDLQSLGKAEVEVEVPAELFAPEPPSWLKKWVNLWYETPPRDQCAFRRRYFFAFSFKPLFVAGLFLVLSLANIVATIAALLCGYRFGGFRRDEKIPWWTCDISPYSRLWHKTDAEGMWSGYYRSPICRSLTPLIGVMIFAFLELGHWLSLTTVKPASPQWSWIKFQQLNHWELAGLSFVLMALGVVLASLYVGLSYLWRQVEKAAEAYQKKQQLKLMLDKPTRSAAEKEKVTAPISHPFALKPDLVLDPLILRRKPEHVGYDYLPASHRTLKLHFQAIKAAVCRPFAK